LDSRILATPLRSELGSDTGLFFDYVGATSESLSEILGSYNLPEHEWRSRTTPGTAYRMSDALTSHMVTYNSEFGAGPEMIGKIEMAGRGEARFVVTGQQPGAVGGPLMVLHKAAATVALARHLQAITGVPCVPLFWVGSDDTDFSEIRETVIPGTDLHALAASISTDDHEIGMPVGAIDANAIRKLWNSLAPFAAAHAGGAFVVAEVEAAIAAGADHGAITAQIISRLFGGKIALIDGRSATLRESARELVLDYFERESEIKRLVTEQGQSLEEIGYHAQLRPGSDSGVFVLEGGKRHTVTDDSRGEVRERLLADITIASPGVILRNLIQDSVFSPVAVVLGPAEIAYRAQMQGVYRSMGVAAPVAFPRLFATCAPPSIAEVARLTGADPVSLARDVKSFVQFVFDTRSDPAAKDAADHFREAFADHAAQFLGAAGGGMPDREREKLGKRLEDISRRLDKVLDTTQTVGKAHALDRWPYLAATEELFARKGVSQERYLSMLTPFLFGGETAADTIALAAEAHIHASLDGRLLHVVYST